MTKTLNLEKLYTDSVELIHYARNVIVKHVNIADYDILFIGKMDSRDPANGAETCKIWK